MFNNAICLLALAFVGAVGRFTGLAEVPTTDIILCIVGANICTAIANKR